MHFSELWNYKIPHSPYDSSCIVLCPIFSVKQLFTQTAALAIHCSWEAIKKSSQCCVLVDALLFQHVTPFLMHPPFPFMYTHPQAISFLSTRMCTCSWVGPSRVSVTKDLSWNGDLIFFFFLKRKAPNCSDMVPLDLRHYWGQRREEPCNL